MKKFLVVLVLFCAFFKMFAEDDEKLRLAVMEFEDRSGKISKQTLSDATEYVRASIISSNTYIVISKERQEQEMIKEMKKESYKACNDKNCQIPLGQALSADTIMRTTITLFGGVYTISSELIDLEKEATIIGAKKNYDGSEESMREALDFIVEKVISTYQGMVSAEKEAQTRESRKAEEAEQQRIAEEKRKAEADKNMNAAKLKDDGLLYRNIGISVLVVGSAIGAVLAGCSDITRSTDKDGAPTGPMSTGGKAMLASGLIILGGSIAGGTVLIVKGVRMKKEGERLELNNVSVLPTNDGFYASVGFNF